MALLWASVCGFISRVLGDVAGWFIAWCCHGNHGVTGLRDTLISESTLSGFAIFPFLSSPLDPDLIHLGECLCSTTGWLDAGSQECAKPPSNVFSPLQSAGLSPPSHARTSFSSFTCSTRSRYMEWWMQTLSRSGFQMRLGGMMGHGGVSVSPEGWGCWLIEARGYGDIGGGSRTSFRGAAEAGCRLLVVVMKC